MIDEVKQELQNHEKRNLVINSVPISVIKKFKEYCEVECGNVYSVGIYQLLKIKENYEQIVPLLINILDELNTLKKQKNERRKTFAECD